MFRKKWAALLLTVILLLGSGNALAYTADEIAKMQSLVGQYGIQSVAQTLYGVEIGVSDMSDANLNRIDAAITAMGINTGSAQIYNEAAWYQNEWYIGYRQAAPELGDESLPLYLMGGFAMLAAAGMVLAHKKRTDAV